MTNSIEAPYFSLVVPAYNKEKFIADLLQTVLRQNFAGWECIVVDDCSTDGTWEAIRETSALDGRVRTLKLTENMGANFCRNKGVEMSKGKYILFVDADDLLEPFCLEQRAAFLKKHREPDAGIFPMKVFKNDPSVVKRVWVPLQENALQRFLAHDLPWHTMQPAWKKEYLNRLGGYNRSYPRLQDVEFHTRALLDESFRFATAPELPPDCAFRTDENRNSFDMNTFLNKWMRAGNMYFLDFWEEARKRNMSRFLAGTIYRTYYQLLLQLKAGSISKEMFSTLSELLLTPAVKTKLKPSQQLILTVLKTYILLPVSIPGVNRVLNRLIIR